MAESSGAKDTLAHLLCNESESSLNEDDETIRRSENENEFKPHCVLIGEEDEEYVEKLVREENHRFETRLTKSTSSSSFRLLAIDWILTTRVKLGFQHQTAYIAISYLDLFLERRFIGRDESWPIRLLSIGCLSLAAKIEERNVPGLSEYPQDEIVFKSDVIRKTELLILSTLNWKMNIITPFHYLHYFIAKTSSAKHVEESMLLSRSSESLLNLSKEISFNDHRQFIVAAAATLLVSSTLESKLTMEEIGNKFESISWWRSNENENVYSCYVKMQEIEEEKRLRTPPEIQQPVVATVASGSGVKRRLSFDDSDQTSPTKKMR